MNTLLFDISHLIDKETGVSELFSFIGPADIQDIRMNSDISGKVEFMRIENGINVTVSSCEGKVILDCEKCLEEYQQDIKIDFAERIFYLNRPSKVEDINDLFLVDKKKLKIDLNEMLRQELLLHYPIITVCSKKCRGICPCCGKNLNKEKCNCKIESTVESNDHKPLSDLKKLLK